MSESILIHMFLFKKKIIIIIIFNAILLHESFVSDADQDL